MSKTPAAKKNVARTAVLVAAAPADFVAAKNPRAEVSVKLAKPGAEIATRFVGFCAICERDIKLTYKPGFSPASDNAVEGLVLVHHGYQRPGDGMIHGDCRCVHEQPYEVSCEPLRPYLAELQSVRAALVATLLRLENKPVDFYAEVWSHKDAARVIKHFHRDTCESYEFDRALETKISNLRHELKGVESRIARIESFIAEWVRKPVRTFDEVAEEKKRISDAARAQKQAERDAKNKVKTDRKAAIAAKHIVSCKAIADLAAELIAARSAGTSVSDDRWYRRWQKLGNMLKKERGFSDFNRRDREMFTEETIENLRQIGYAEMRNCWGFDANNQRVNNPRVEVNYYGPDNARPFPTKESA